jgi:hypothetical protein
MLVPLSAEERTGVASTHARVKSNFLFEDAGVINDVKHIPGEFHLFSLVLPK